MSAESPSALAYPGESYLTPRRFSRASSASAGMNTRPQMRVASSVPAATAARRPASEM